MRSDAAAIAAPASRQRALFSARSAHAAPASGTNGSTWWTMSQPVFSPRYAYIATEESAQPARKRSADVKRDQRVAIERERREDDRELVLQEARQVERLRAADALHLVLAPPVGDRVEDGIARLGMDEEDRVEDLGHAEEEEEGAERGPRRAPRASR